MRRGRDSLPLLHATFAALALVGAAAWPAALMAADAGRPPAGTYDGPTATSTTRPDTAEPREGIPDGRVAAEPPGRVSEPVVIRGEGLGHFQQQPAERVGVWAWREGAWVRLASQVDARDDDGDYVAQDDDAALDANDELVFMAEDLGDPRPEASWPPGVDRGRSPAEIEVTDPLNASYVGHAYVFDSPPTQHDPRLRFDDATGEIRSERYTLGFATPSDGFFGVKRLSLFGDPLDRIDRSKVRISVPVLGDFDEESLGDLGGLPEVSPVAAGPVRLILDASGGSVAYAGRAKLFHLDLGGNIPAIPGLEVRLSLDFAPNASGATFAAETVPGGVAVDGQPDSVRPLPFPMWREVAFEEGRLAILAEGEPPPLLVRTYYRDDATPDADDTGDGLSYGDNGVVASTLQGLADVGFLGQMVALAPDDLTTAEDLADHLANPLEVSVDVEALPQGGTILLPLAVRGQ